MAVILKKDKVRIGGSVKLGQENTCAAAQTGPAESTGCGQVQAKIVETTDNYAVIEVICGCGGKSYIQCEF
ncbi:MAG: hypothetical protein A2Y07_05100 [Planctomycetes bacterium GWF2_50_10]|nr:MAG: hypothetical protein A2Y07_05100 [Planctomycetes bacterium GWF2_50_10]